MFLVVNKHDTVKHFPQIFITFCRSQSKKNYNSPSLVSYSVSFLMLRVYVYIHKLILQVIKKILKKLHFSKFIVLKYLFVVNTLIPIIQVCGRFIFKKSLLLFDYLFVH